MSRKICILLLWLASLAFQNVAMADDGGENPDTHTDTNINSDGTETTQPLPNDPIAVPAAQNAPPSTAQTKAAAPANIAKKPKYRKRSSSSQKKSAEKSQKLAIETAKSQPFDTWESPKGTSEIGLPIAEGFAQPYPYCNLMRQFNGGNCRHRGHDIGACGEPHGGVGRPVNAATHSVITLIGNDLVDPANFGQPDKRTGDVERTSRHYPRQIIANGYGLVYPFSRTYGKWRSGNVIVTKIVGGPLDGYTLRYMHLAAIRPDLKVGDVIEPGMPIALMGGTAVQESFPHVHIDLADPTGKRVDFAPYIGLPATGDKCANIPAKKKAAPSKSKKKSTKSTTAKKVAAKPVKKANKTPSKPKKTTKTTTKTTTKKKTTKRK